MASYWEIPGGVCAAKGFKAGGVHCGFKRKNLDLAIIFSEAEASVAGVFTTNIACAAPVKLCKARVASGKAWGVIANSGNANACTMGGDEAALQMAVLAEEATNVGEAGFLVASTGVIGEELDVSKVESHIKELASLASYDCEDAARAIMTTDTYPKVLSCAFKIGGVECHIGGIAKGSGMIHPNMATLLVFVTTDAAVPPAVLQAALSEDVKDSFNMVSVDGDTSTNDSCIVFANGLAGNAPIEANTKEFAVFCEALAFVTQGLSKMLAHDGEGATKLLTVHVSGAQTKSQARTVARSIVSSNLVKAAVFGEDANWGRIMCAAGYSGEDFDVSKTSVSFASEFGKVTVALNGVHSPFSEDEAAKVLSAKQIEILFGLGQGEEQATAWGCDLTYDYVKINGEYRS